MHPADAAVLAKGPADTADAAKAATAARIAADAATAASAAKAAADAATAATAAKAAADALDAAKAATDAANAATTAKAAADAATKANSETASKAVADAAAAAKAAADAAATAKSASDAATTAKATADAAAAVAAKNPIATPLNFNREVDPSEDDMAGDKFRFEVDTDPFLRDSAEKNKGIRLGWGLKIIKDDLRGNLLVRLNPPPFNDEKTCHKKSCHCDDDSLYATCTDKMYVADKRQLLNNDFRRYGFSGGILAIPYKYYKTSKAFTGNVTLGPYIGYHDPLLDGVGISFKYIAFAGISPISVSSVDNGKTKSDNLTGFSWGLGILCNLRKKSGFTFGVVVGRDYVGSNSSTPFAHEGEGWISGAIGYSFSN